MDQNSKLMLTHPAYIISGSRINTSNYALGIILKEFCSFGGCNICIKCKQINEKNFYSIKWLTAERQYNVEDIESIFEVTTLENNINEKFIFIIESAERLNEHASNKLLKLLEEPPSGYHFFLLTNNTNEILPTIRSRCVEKQLENTPEETNTIIKIFTSTLMSPNEFLNYLNKSDINEIDTKNYLENIFIYWINQFKNSANRKNFLIINLIHQTFNQLPMAGGSKIFWKNFYLKFCMLR